MKNLIFGITGPMGNGKTTLSDQLQKRLLASNTTLHVIEIDNIRKNSLISNSKSHIKMRYEISQSLHIRPLNEFYHLPEKRLRENIFKNKSSLNLYSSISTPYLKEDVKSLLKDLYDRDTLDRGIYVAIVWAQLLEEGYEEFINSFIVLSNCPASVWDDRLEKAIQTHETNLEIQEIIRRTKIMPTFEEKLSLAKEVPHPYIIMDNSADILMKTSSNTSLQLTSKSRSYDFELKKIIEKIAFFKSKKQYSPPVS